METPDQLNKLIAFHRRELGLQDEDLRRIVFTNRFGPMGAAETTPVLKLVGEYELFSPSLSTESEQSESQFPDAAQA